MTPEESAALRAPFPDAAVGKLPKPHKKDAQKGKCSECGGWHGLPAAHLDYVGHAAVTDRLLQVDPGWSWEPVSFDADGLPRLTKEGGLWIRLTVAGVTRYGYGDATMGHGVKELIGDAIRNAAMRFGVALYLWSKEEILQTLGEDAPRTGGKPIDASIPKHVPDPDPPPPLPPQRPEPKTAAPRPGDQVWKDAIEAVMVEAEKAGLTPSQLDTYASRHYRTQPDASGARPYVGSVEGLRLDGLVHLRKQVASGAVDAWLAKQNAAN